MATQREIVGATFSAFADIIEKSLNGSGEIKKGVLKSPNDAVKILGVTFAASYFKHGVWRFSGLHHTMEMDAILFLRAVSQDLSTSNNSLGDIIVNQQAALLPNLPVGSKLAIGLEDNDTQYSGDLIVIGLQDLGATTIQTNGSLGVKIDGSVETLSFNFQNKTLGDWVNQYLPVQPTVKGP